MKNVNFITAMGGRWKRKNISIAHTKTDNNNMVLPPKKKTENTNKNGMTNKSTSHLSSLSLFLKPILIA